MARLLQAFADPRLPSDLRGLPLWQSTFQLAGFDLEARIGHQVTLAARRRGAIIRPLGDTVVLMPPLAMGLEDLKTIVDAVAAEVGALRADGTFAD